MADVLSGPQILSPRSLTPGGISGPVGPESGVVLSLHPAKPVTPDGAVALGLFPKEMVP